MRPRGSLALMNVGKRIPKMTQDEFLIWAQTQPVRYEFDGFEPVAMTGGSPNHSLIASNIHLALGTRLRGGRCVALTADAGIQTTGTKTRYPDGLVTCSPFDARDKIVPKPVVVFEVISPSTEHDDRVEKRDEYEKVPSILRYVIVEQAFTGLTVHWRDKSDAMFQTITLEENNTLNLSVIGVSVPVSEFYERVDFGEDATER